ncbi:S26 family signal peptidase [Bremerella sp. JC770]|uniref:S26 family signal peptidase n=1 Tax=Bremerella sp. JC770 TaxID=3232137 RepID=UPI00345B30F3
MRLGPLLILLIFTACVAAFAVATAKPDPVYRVASGSMAPALFGPHYPLTCQRCQLTTALDATNLPKLATCPNCGFQDNPVDASQLRPGQGLVWEAIEPGQLKRWDIVLLEDADTNTWQVKRVAFLPGETPRIRQGELYRDAQLIRKSPREREALKQLVFDQAHAPPETPRFRSYHAAGSGWNVRRGSLGFAPIGDDQANSSDWLVYHHHRCLPPPSPNDHAASPLDSYGYNHSVSRELFPVSDLWIEFVCAHWQARQLAIRVQGRDQVSTIEVDLDRSIVQGSSNEQAVTLPLSVDSLAGMTVRAGECDRQLFLELERDRRHWFFPLGEAAVPLGNQPLAVKIGDGQAILRQVKIYRDIFWLGRERRATPWSWDRALAPHEIFVLGDNVPISDDSRFELGPVDVRKNLRGKVLRVLAE